MINNLRYLLLAAFCACLMTGGAAHISAQSNDQVVIAASGKTLRQADVNGLIEFYEWAFETKFSAAQRAQFTANTIEEFRAKPAESRATFDSLLDSFGKILAASEEAQQKTRKNLLAAFLIPKTLSG